MLEQENWFDANTSVEEKGHHELWTTKRKKIDDKLNHVTNLHKKHTKNGKQKQNKSSWDNTKNIINYNKQEKDDLPTTKKRMNREKTKGLVKKKQRNMKAWVKNKHKGVSYNAHIVNVSQKNPCQYLSTATLHFQLHYMKEI
jgi:hypothetical protein